MTLVFPPRAEWHDTFLLNTSRRAFTWPYYTTSSSVGIMECVLNLWQSRKDKKLKEHTEQRRQYWIEQAKTLQNTANHQKIAIITGGNAGLGYEVSKALVLAGFRIIIACRSVSKGKEAIEKIENELGIKTNASAQALDLSSFDSINKFVDEYKASGLGLDVLINNAGMMDVPFKLTQDGYESQFGVNHLGHYLLTMKLLPVLAQSSEARIVVLSSGALFASDSIRYDKLRTKSNGYSRLGHYSYSKLANLLFVKALDRKLKARNITNVIINACHPGACLTELFRENALMYFVTSKVVKGIMRTPADGALTTVYLAIAPEVTNVSGEYFFDQIPRTVSAVGNSVEAQDELWAYSVEATGADFTL